MAVEAAVVVEHTANPRAAALTEAAVANLVMEKAKAAAVVSTAVAVKAATAVAAIMAAVAVARCLNIKIPNLGAQSPAKANPLVVFQKLKKPKKLTIWRRNLLKAIGRQIPLSARSKVPRCKRRWRTMTSLTMTQ